MVSIFSVILIIFTHFVFDFIFQDTKWAVNKSHSFVSLLKHVFVYSLMMSLVMFFLLDLTGVIMFFIITFSFHLFTDYYSSKVISNMFKKKQFGTSIPNLGAFSFIGFDQFLHYLQLFLTYYLLI